MTDEPIIERVFLVEGAEENGLATMLCALLNDNIAVDERKLALFARLGQRIGLVATDADVSLTMVFSYGVCEIHDGLLPDCDVVLEASATAIEALHRAPRVGGLPDLRRAEGRLLAWDLLRRQLRVRHLHRHPLALWRFTQLLSAAP